MRKVMTSLTLLLAALVITGCGGRKLVDGGGGADNEILFLNETPLNVYRIQVVDTTADFTLRAESRKAVTFPPVKEDHPGFNVNIEKIEGEVGDVRKTLTRVKPGETVHIWFKPGTTTGGELSRGVVFIEVVFD